MNFIFHTSQFSILNSQFPNVAYTKFTLEKLYETFSLSKGSERLFDEISPVEPSDWLLKTFEVYQKLPKRSEKARSETIVVPILAELANRNNNRFTVFSGVDLKVDVKLGLNGETDFLLAATHDLYTIEAPIFSVVQAQKQDIDLGMPQCLAQLLGAQLFNEKHNQPMTLYGCVTTADTWQFVRLEKKKFSVDTQLYFIDNLSLLLGVMQWIVDQTPFQIDN